MFNYRNISKKSNYLKKNKDNRITLDAKHNEQITKFRINEKKIPMLLIKLKKNMLKLDNTNSIEKRKILEIKIKKIKNKIIKLKNKKKIINYYLKTGNFLCNYYDNKKNNNIKNKIKNNFLDKKNNVITLNKINDKKSFNNIVDFFNNNTNIIKKSTEQSFTNTKISKFVKTDNSFKRTDYLNEYLIMIDKNYIPKILYNNDINKCKDCNIEMTVKLSNGIQICENCGIQNRILIESNKPSFKDPPPEVSYFAYKRINHFNECLAQFQGKESTIVPQEVYDSLLLEIKKERISNLATLNYYKIRQYLKKLKLNKYYEHIPHILNRINGIPPPVLSKSLEKKLRLMFKEIQIPFREVCPKNRKNFLSYFYILHKFVELLELDEFKYYFPLLKDKNKLYQTDLIWKGICNILGWEFIKSI